MSQNPKTRGKRGTYSRIISRTTSESLRLVEPEKANNGNKPTTTSSSLSLAPLQPKSASSFVVTSVVHSGRGDAAAESPEDESRSDDISRVTDLETPSCSEETYSKDVDEELPYLISGQHYEQTQPIVPFEDQMAATTEQSVPTTDIIPVTKSLSVQPEKPKRKHIRKPMQTFPVSVKKSEENVFAAQCSRLIGRFQVIKVESLVPFHRGRWTCHDYLDNSKHAPKDGLVFYKDRFVMKKDFERLKEKEKLEQSKEDIPSAPGTGDGSLMQSSPVTAQSNQGQIDQYGNQNIISTWAPICHPQTQTSIHSVSIPTTVDTNIYQNPDLQGQTFMDPNATSYTCQNVTSEWAPVYQYGGETHPTSIQYQTSVDSTVGASTSQQQISDEQSTNNAAQNFISYQYVEGNQFTNVQHQVPENNQYTDFRCPTSTGQTFITDNQMAHYVLENQSTLQYQTSLDSSRNIQVYLDTNVTSTEIPMYVQKISKIQHQTSVDSALNPKIEPCSSQNILQKQTSWTSSCQTTQRPFELPLNFTNVQFSATQNAPIQHFSLENQTERTNQFINTNVQYSLVNPSQSTVPTGNIVQDQNISLGTFMQQSQTMPLNELGQTNTSFGSIQSPQVIPSAVFSSEINQTFNVANQYNVAISNVQDILHENVPDQMIMQYDAMQSNVPSQEGFNIHGTVVNTPPPTPNIYTTKAINTVQNQYGQLQISVTQTPPQTPIITNQSILQHSIISPIALTPSSVFSPVLPHIHSIQSPCIYTNVCYPNPYTFLAGVPYPLPSERIGQSSHNLHYLHRQRYYSAPTLSDYETRELLEEVESLLNNESHPVDTEEEFVVVIKRARSVPCEISMLTKENVIDSQETSKQEPKNSINDDVIGNENVINSESLNIENELSNATSITAVDASKSLSSTLDISNIAKDSSEDKIQDIVSFCLDSIYNSALGSIEKKLIEEKQKKFDEKLQLLFQQAAIENEDKSKVSKLIDSETGRVIIIGAKKSRTYVPPFSSLKLTSSSSTSSLSDTDYIKSMTFTNTKLEEESPAEDLISFDEDWVPTESNIQIDATTSTTDLQDSVLDTENNLNNKEDGLPDPNLPLDLSLGSKRTPALLELEPKESNKNGSATTTPDMPLDLRLNISTPETPSLDTETATTVVAASTATTPELLPMTMLTSSPVDKDESATTTPEVHSREMNVSSSFEEIYRVTSCASSVIDTKIERAMDMVKTHLMSSMRAEVESLKARIAELMERIHQLEMENDFLKANASPEVLHALRNGAAQPGRVQESSLQNNNFVISSPTQSATI